MRIKLPHTAVYHVITRTVAGEMLLDAPAKEVLRKMIWQVAAFSGVEVLTYCIMTNHLHLLVRVPEAREEELTRAELLRRYGFLYGEGYAGPLPDVAAMRAILSDDSEEAARWEARLRARMNDVSAFMKTLKQRYSWWFNKAHKRFGTLWAERFKSVLVEDDPYALTVVAAYIDLNPVRAGLAEDPADYRWCGYTEAMAGEPAAQAGLQSVCRDPEWGSTLKRYRMVIFGKGGQGRIGEQGAITAERVEAVLVAGGRVSVAELLRCRVRYLSQGAILGREAFVRSAAARAPHTDRRRQERKRLGKLAAEELGELRSWRRPGGRNGIG